MTAFRSPPRAFRFNCQRTHLCAKNAQKSQNHWVFPPLSAPALNPQLSPLNLLRHRPPALSTIQYRLSNFKPKNNLHDNTVAFFHL
jgi:hypothetical protein